MSHDQFLQALDDREKYIQSGIYEAGDESRLDIEKMDIRLVTAIEIDTGKIVWQKPVDFTGCGGYRLGSAYHKDGILCFFGHLGNHDRRLFQQGSLKWRRITAIDANTGNMIWSRPLNYLRRPLIVGDQMIIEPRACAVHTGKIVMRKHPISGESAPWEFFRPGHSCSITSAAANCILSDPIIMLSMIWMMTGGCRFSERSVPVVGSILFPPTV